ncbi:MAG: hypothetical protein VYC34_03950, partial [Planctomycetota bacterium]|nr:hypothetical protein [Planctomycetota bacterium]
MMSGLKRFACAAMATVAGLAGAASAGSQAIFRVDSISLRDPHAFQFVIILCVDITGQLNAEIDANLNDDGDMNGLLDLGFVIVFDDLDPMAMGGSVRIGEANCTAPAAGTNCTEGMMALESVPYMNTLVGMECLGIVPGTVRPYSPAVTTTTGPCFSTSAQSVTLDLGGIPVTLQDAQFAATYVGGADPTSLTNGLIRGFLSEADAEATVLPPDVPIVGGQTLAALLRGGSGNCASGSDQDVLNSVPGWWMYLNFTATRVVGDFPVACPTDLTGDGV